MQVALQDELDALDAIYGSNVVCRLQKRVNESNTEWFYSNDYCSCLSVWRKHWLQDASSFVPSLIFSHIPMEEAESDIFRLEVHLSEQDCHSEKGRLILAISLPASYPDKATARFALVHVKPRSQGHYVHAMYVLLSNSCQSDLQLPDYLAYWKQEGIRETLMQQLLDATANQGVMLDVWIDACRNACRNAIQHQLDNVKETKLPIIVSSPKMLTLPEKWPHGPVHVSEVLVDRKSVFIAHAARITCPAEMSLFLSFLIHCDPCQTRRHYAEATHHITAYRVTNANQKVEDAYDDDGEYGAGTRVLVLMQKSKVMDVAVIVTRWYGGVMLHGDRFRNIVACAKQVLTLGGWMGSS